MEAVRTETQAEEKTRSKLDATWWLSIAAEVFSLFALNCLALYQNFAHSFLPVFDNGVTIYLVRGLKAGLIPHLDIYSHHFVGYVLLFRLADYILPLTSSPNAYWLLIVLFNFASTILIYQTLRCLEVSTSYTWLGALFTATVGWFPSFQGTLSNVQSCLLPFLNLLMFLLIHAALTQSFRMFYAAAFCYGLMLTLDQRLLFFGILFLPALCAIPGARGVRSLLCAALIAAAPALTGLLWIHLHGALAEFYRQTVEFPMHYRNAGEQGMSSLLCAVWNTHIWPNRGPFALALIGTAGSCLLERRKWLPAILVLQLTAASLYVLAGGRCFANYMLLLVPWVCLTFPLAFVYAERFCRGTSARVSLRLVAWLLPACIALNFILNPLSPGKGGDLLPLVLTKTILPYETNLPPGEQPEDETRYSRKLAKVITSLTSPEDRILVWSPKIHLYNASERFSSARDPGLITIAQSEIQTRTRTTDTRTVVPAMLDEFKAGLESAPPKLIIRPRGPRICDRSIPRPVSDEFRLSTLPHLAFFNQYAASHYQLVKTFCYKKASADLLLRR